MSDQYHVIPIDDILEHAEDEYCNCNPQVEVYENGLVIIHNSFDYREVEQNNRNHVFN